MPSPAPVRPGTTRRAALTVSGLALALGGCGDAGRPGAPRTSARAPSDSDEEVLLTVRAELAGALRQVADVRREHRSLRGRLAPLQRAHEAQRAALDPDAPAPDPGPVGDVPTDPADALARVRRDEERLRRRLVTWAVAVESGPLARLLAATSAGVAQQLALLGPEDPAA